MKILIAVMLCAGIAAADPVDVPMKEVPVELPPLEAHDEAVRVLTCERDLKDCTAAGKLEPKWLVVGVTAGVVAGVLIGLAAGFALAKKAGP